MSQYEFVAVEAREGKRSDPTRSTRSHAIRTALRNRRYDPTSKSFARPPYRTGSRERSGLRPRIHGRVAIETPYRDQEQPVAYCIRDVSSGSIDPFSSLPVPVNSEVDHLVRYCK